MDTNAGQSEEINMDTPASANQLLAESSLDGTVLVFSEASCVLTPTIHEDGLAYSKIVPEKLAFCMPWVFPKAVF